MHYPTDFHQAMNEAECLYNIDEINAALDRMAQEITTTLTDQHPLVISVLSGALVVTGHLLTRLHFPLELDYIHVTRYRGGVRGGDLHWLVEPRRELKNRVILLVDDIMDGGLTLAAIIDYCQQMGARAVYSAVLVNKQRQREAKVNFEPDFYGMKTEDRFLFGFGLDYQEELRNAPGIYAFRE